MLWTAPAPRHRSAVDWLSQPERFKEVRQATTVAFEGIGEDRRGNADKVDPGIGTTRVGQRIFECVFTIGTRSAQSIMASGFTAAQTGRTHDRTRPMLQQLRKFLPRRRRPHMTQSGHAALVHSASLSGYVLSSAWGAHEAAGISRHSWWCGGLADRVKSAAGRARAPDRRAHGISRGRFAGTSWRRCIA